MPKFKIRAIVKNVYFASYLDPDKNFDFYGQKSDGCKRYTLFTGTTCELDFEAVKELPISGDVVDCEGVWYNFTKKETPEMVFCVTKVNFII